VRRRTLLKGALGVAGLFLLGGPAGLVALRGCAPGVAGLRCLTANEHRTLSQLATALFPAGGAFALGAAGLDLAGMFDGFLADEPEDRQSDLKMALLIFEYGPVLFDKKLCTFSNLSEADRLAHYEAWQTSDDPVRRQVAVGLRKFLAVVFYDRPEAWGGIGYALPEGV
jgi:hypothetical protein